VEEATARWAIQFGFTESSREPGRVRLKCGYEPYSLELIRADDVGFDHTGYELARDTSLQDAALHLDHLGISFESRASSIFLADADGFGVQLVPYAPWKNPFPDIARSTDALHGFRPRKLGHVNFLTGRLSEQLEFYTKVMGMRITDRLGDEGVWLHINADHHVMALVNKGYPHIHHFALEMVDWGELRVAFDHLAQHGRWLAWGPVRHGLGRNLSGYVRIPEDECFVEVYTDMEQLENDHVPRDWPDDAHSSNVWGTLPPRSYFRFDEAAIHSERKGLEALGIPLM